MIASTVIPSVVSQSSVVITTSCDTSTSLLVRYPELAVLRAVSARPFRAPCVEVKYSSIDRPSLKFDVIALSIILPSGLDIRPLIPANCLICAAEPLAPESAYINTLLNDGITSSLPFLSTSTLSPRAFIIEDATFSLVLDQISIILLYFSPFVRSPDSNCCSIFLTSDSALEIISFLSSGTSKSFTPIEAPEVVEYSNPRYINLSANRTDSFRPKSL